jgi:hypothetical protein
LKTTKHFETENKTNRMDSIEFWVEKLKLLLEIREVVGETRKLKCTRLEFFSIYQIAHTDNAETRSEECFYFIISVPKMLFAAGDLIQGQNKPS